MKIRNKIWSVSLIELTDIVNKSSTLSDILKAFGLSTASANYVALKSRLKKDNIDFSHIILGLNSNKNKSGWRKGIATPLSLVLIEDSTYSRGQLKLRLLKYGLLNNVCYECGVGQEWNGKPLSLQIDHINGIGNDNRIENLRILCPNCHTQTDNYAGKNISIKHENLDTVYCIDCGKQIGNNSIRCIDCSNKNKGKLDWSKFNNLDEMVTKYGFCGAGRILGVSDNAIRKHLKNTKK